MKPPVDHVKVSAKGKDILIRIKRNTGLEHWNEICRIALCHSLANPTPPPQRDKAGDSNIDMDWKTFAGQYQDIFSALITSRAIKDNINNNEKEIISEYFRNHLERGISSLQKTKKLSAFLQFE